MNVGEALKEVSAKGKIFRVNFIARGTGVERVMVCRMGVKKGVKGVGLAFDQSAKGLIPVYDVQKRGYRFISAEGIREIAGVGRVWRIPTAQN